MSFKTSFLLLLVLLILAGFFVFTHFKHAQRKDHFREHGIVTDARVTKLESSYKDRRRLSGRLRILKDYKVEVSYFTQVGETPDPENQKIIERDEDGSFRMNFQKPSEMGELVIATIKVKRDHHKHLQEGDRIEVLYLPDDITNAILKKEIN